MKLLKVYETLWLSENKIDFPITTKLSTFYKKAIEYITSYEFKQDEFYASYVER